MENVLRTYQQHLADREVDSFYCAKHNSKMISVSPCLLPISVFSAAGLIPLPITNDLPLPTGFGKLNSISQKGKRR